MSTENKIPTVANFMTRIPVTIRHDAPLSDAHAKMRKHQFRHLPVLEGSVVVGVVSLGDLHLIETFEDINQDEVPVEDAMSSPVYFVKESDQIHEVAAKMAHDRLGSAVVLDDEDKVVGMFTVTDALIALLHAWKRA